MKVFILAGGKATRFNNGKPGPLKTILKIGKKTILEHILQIFGNNKKYQFYLLSGYKHKKLSLFCKNFSSFNKIKIQTIYSGQNTQTGGRILYIKKYVKKDENFILTYGDSLANFNLTKAVKLKKKNNFVISVYKRLLPYGILNIKNNKLLNFQEKNFFNYINAGFYIFDYNIFRYIKYPNDRLEIEVIKKILKNKTIICNTLNRWQPIDDENKLMKAKNLLKKDKNYFLKK
jgi:glucose-1-phosphate cytidylyltransferase